ncbi:probable serine/threonine-protein kinase clkA [Paramacrobiotus metropolitanus]|uniref:probable serine/threonine-protein kinase clkA n=1 Tax=Paramacrobiotus metropolitanus TaxID=2943436 RepID=UPI0024463E29|nr:probable serine/threonine-protein kinase clkA [Paramacrobiotus metropolitanus]
MSGNRRNFMIGVMIDDLNRAYYQPETSVDGLLDAVLGNKHLPLPQYPRLTAGEFLEVFLEPRLGPLIMPHTFIESKVGEQGGPDQIWLYGRIGCLDDFDNIKRALNNAWRDRGIGFVRLLLPGESNALKSGQYPATGGSRENSRRKDNDRNDDGNDKRTTVRNGGFGGRLGTDYRGRYGYQTSGEYNRDYGGYGTNYDRDNRGGSNTTTSYDRDRYDVNRQTTGGEATARGGYYSSSSNNWDRLTYGADNYTSRNYGGYGTSYDRDNRGGSNTTTSYDRDRYDVNRQTTGGEATARGGYYSSSSNNWDRLTYGADNYTSRNYGGYGTSYDRDNCGSSNTTTSYDRDRYDGNSYTTDGEATARGGYYSSSSNNWDRPTYGADNYTTRNYGGYGNNDRDNTRGHSYAIR